MQHLEICLLTDLPTTGGYFSFHLTFRIIVLLSGSYRHKIEYKCCRVSISVFLGFRRGKCRKRFIDGCLYDSSRGILRRTTGKIFLTFQIFSLCALPVAAKKWNTAAIKILPLFEPSVICYLVWVKESFATGFQWKWRLSLHDFTAEKRESFFTSLNRFQELHTRLAWVIITVFASF